ncbi:structural protein [Cellulophaga phage Omtje_3]|uniref:Structural protein n=1 Tax=Cellulophaga phage Omtje_1 TaxID=2745694 RepID=A0A8E4ZJQ9_9VIRU|nr:structural protein [Cellulophaga phage Omtje_1]QQV90359.1 structural protein [Cellulophaga phage Omtje_2]QQV90372.1 structural protein [Cellulophaga phage Omtje_3]QQV90385.1 structural protein [Cellulophaga phage Omtje_4]QQV90398.1 structural protein [Cellulophaga phage Omtje_5]
MAYKNKNSNGSYNRSNQNGNNNSNATQFKKSGVVYSPIKGRDGLYMVNAWNASAKGLLLAKCFPYHASTDKDGAILVVRSQKGSQYIKMMCELTYRKTGITRLLPCLMNIETHVVALSEIGMVISPNGHGKTRSGKTAKGYFGTFK